MAHGAEGREEEMNGVSEESGEMSVSCGGGGYAAGGWREEERRRAGRGASVPFLRVPVGYLTR